MNTFLSGTKTGEFGLAEFFISVLFSLIMGVICMVIYRVYFGRSLDRNESLAKSFIFMAPSVTAIFWAIQYSLPLSLGLLGALSFVRFRTPIKDPEEVAYILLLVASSIACATYNFALAGMILLIVFVAQLIYKKVRTNRFFNEQAAHARPAPVPEFVRNRLRTRVAQEARVPSSLNPRPVVARDEPKFRHRHVRDAVKR